jgi:hypothetical protein
VIPSAYAALKLLPKLDCVAISQKFAFLYYAVLNVAFLRAVMRISVLPLNHPSFLMCAAGYLLIVISDTFLFCREFGVTTTQR